MQGAVSWEVLNWGIGTIIFAVATSFGIWWRIESRIKEERFNLQKDISNVEKFADDVENKAEVLAAQLTLLNTQFAEYRTYVAENYVSKQGHRESMEQVMDALRDFGQDMRAVRDRLDKLIDQRNT